MFEQTEISDSIRDVLDDICSSLALHNHLAGRDDRAGPIWRQGVELGWLALSIPEAQGGLGLGSCGSALLHYELGRFCAPGPFIATTCSLDILSTVDDAIAGDLIAGVLAGEATLAVPAELRHGKGAPAGSLRLLGNADAAAALVPADNSTDLWLVALDQGAGSMFRTWDETRAIIEVEAGSLRRLAVLPGARKALELRLAIALAADSAGLARGIADRTVAFMKKREQFGRPIGSFQALKHRAANLRARSMYADYAVLNATESRDADQDSALVWALLAKAEACEVGCFVAADCVQLFGGVGFTVEYDPHIYVKRAYLNQQLLMPGNTIKDYAARELDAAARSGIETMELAR